MADEKPKTQFYSGEEIEELSETKVPRFLKWLYILLPIWGLVWAFMYWNGSSGVLDKGQWHGLEKAAKTTYPFEKPDKN